MIVFYTGKLLLFVSFNYDRYHKIDIFAALSHYYADRIEKTNTDKITNNKAVWQNHLTPNNT